MCIRDRCSLERLELSAAAHVKPDLNKVEILSGWRRVRICLHLVGVDLLAYGLLPDMRPHALDNETFFVSIARYQVAARLLVLTRLM